MSTALAIASVTAVLKDLLNNGVVDHNVQPLIGDVTVSALPPDRIITEGSAEKSQLNIFLYQVTPNAAWRNAALPSRDSRGARLTNPPLALDLHYLLTAYGEKDLHAEILLGYGMQILHEAAVLPRDAIRRSLSPFPQQPFDVGHLPPQLQALFESGLAEQVEQIKVVPQSISTEEISRLWTAFQARYRPTAAYQVSVVLIESRSGAVRAALPARERNVYALPFRQPVVEQLLSRKDAAAKALPDQPIMHDHFLVLRGRQLRGDDTRVNVADLEVVPAGTDVSESEISFQLPAGLLAGVQGVRVVHGTPMGTPLVPHGGVSSDVTAFVLRPHIETLNVNSQPGGSPDVRAGTFDLTVSPAVGREQRVTLLLNELASPPPTDRDAYAYGFERKSPYQEVFPPQTPPPTTNALSIVFADVKPAQYLVRLQVDGAVSPLDTDAVTKAFNGPIVNIV
jgi:hypothetical protein